MKKHSSKLHYFFISFLVTAGVGITFGLVFFWYIAFHPDFFNAPQGAQNSHDNFMGVEGKAGGTVFEKEKRTATLIAVGDIMLSRDVARKINSKGVDYPYDATREYLKTADLTFANLETPITPGPSVPVNSMTFHSDPRVVPGLARAGFDIVSLANNHTPNYGQAGLLDTFRYLSESGIKFVGAGKNSEAAEAPVYIEAKGIKFAFLAYNDTDVVPDSYGASENRAGTNLMDISKVQKAVPEAKKHADVVIVSMHSGTEYIATPNSHQKNFAHAAVDAGADLVIGHHPHVTQTLEKYNGKFIIYSLGNFVFDQMWSQETRRGMTAKIIFSENTIDHIEFHPVLIYDYAKPQLLDGSEKDTVLSRLQYPLNDGSAK